MEEEIRSMIRMTAFLGNFGKEYAHTRHNLPWMLIQELSFFSQLIWKKKFKGEFAGFSLNQGTIYFIKPHTYMNKSGESIQAALDFFKIPARELLVVHDDSELDFAQIEFKSGGGLAGHNGLKSLALSLGMRDFKRLRLGIGTPGRGTLSSFVLGAFTQEESIILPRYLTAAARALEECLTLGFPGVEKTYKKKRFME
jgi:PTH1 family peptidyl-tRNA hydrolase